MCEFLKYKSDEYSSAETNAREPRDQNQKGEAKVWAQSKDAQHKENADKVVEIVRSTVSLEDLDDALFL